MQPENAFAGQRATASPPGHGERQAAAQKDGHRDGASSWNAVSGPLFFPLPGKKWGGPGKPAA
ncbi:MAG: hypothetical protein LBQ69_00860 [Treponema sp.]|nr:hypothetical protein [Treponema sp.]